VWRYTKVYTSVEALQADLNAWLRHYNERSHLGYCNQGCWPYETV